MSLRSNYERSSKQTVLNTIRARLRVNAYKKFVVTVNKFHQFEKVEWKKLVLAEIEATKYEQRKSTSNERQTEFEKCWPYNKHLINLVFSASSSVRTAKTWRAYTIFCITNPNGPYM